MALVLLVAIAVASLVPSSVVGSKTNARTGAEEPTPYALVPASAEPVNDRVVFGDLPADVERFDTNSSFYFVTVTAPAQSVLSWIAGRNDPAVSFLTEEDKFGSRTPTQRREINLQAMRTAEQEAQFLALTTLGYDADIVPGEVIVQEVLCLEVADDGTCTTFPPSAEFIEAADTILEADGVPLDSVLDLSEVLADKQPGDTVDLLVDRPEVGELDVTVELTVSTEDPDRTIVGFRPFDTQIVTLPFEVDIETNQIGGPSAGLAFTLALIDELSPGDLTGGRNVAVTGTVDLEGNVGPIGGLAQKVSAVHQNGVDVFLVPAAQPELQPPEPGEPDERQRLEDAGKGEVQIIPVATLDEALAVLVELGGDPVVPVGAG